MASTMLCGCHGWNDPYVLVPAEASRAQNITFGALGMSDFQSECVSHQSSSRYSPGTSSSGTSRVRTSFPSRPLDCSTPDTTPASNALPSSNNSSTLSESALLMLDKPCRSPVCNPEDPLESAE